MLNHAAIYAAHQRARWMRPDAVRSVRPHAGTYLKPGSDRADFDPALADQRIALEGLGCHLNQIKSDLAWRRLRDVIDRKYSASQVRVPAGSGRESGRWTSGGGGGSSRDAFAQAPGTGEMLDEIVVDGSEVDSALDGPAGNDDAFGSGYDATWDDWPGRQNDSTRDDERPTRVNDTRITNDADPEPVRPGQQYAQLDKITDPTGRPYYERGGHHYLPKGVYRKWNLRPETRRIFENATSGKISGTVRTDPDGVPMGNKWTGENGPHGRYNTAVREMSEGFFRRLDISPEDMTVQQALDLLAEIRNSQDPRIQDFNRAMRMLRRVFRFRIERGE